MMPYNPITVQVDADLDVEFELFYRDFISKLKSRFPEFLKVPLHDAFVAEAKHTYEVGYWKGFKDRGEDIKVRLGLMVRSDCDGATFIDY
jgi:hypothetical protein